MQDPGSSADTVAAGSGDALAKLDGRGECVAGLYSWADLAAGDRAIAGHGARAGEGLLLLCMDKSESARHGV